MYIFVPIINENKTVDWEAFITILEKNPDIVTADNAPQWVKNKLAVLDQGLEFTNLLKNYNMFSDFYTIVDNYFTTIGNHHQHKLLKNELNTKCTITLKLLWTLAIFNSLVGAQPVITLESTVTTKMLATVIELGAAQLEIYYALYFSTTPINSITFFKKYLYMLIHTISINNPTYFKIKSEQKLHFIGLGDFLTEKNSPKQSFSKITLVVLKIKTESNKHKRYLINVIPAQIFFKNNKYYTYNEIKLTANLLILQHYAKEPTVISEKFTEAVTQLSAAQYVVDKQLVEDFTKLINHQLDLLWQDVERLTDIKITSLAEIKKHLTIKSSKIYHDKIIRYVLQQILIDNTTNLQQNNSLLWTMIQKTTINSNLIKRLFTKNKTEQETIIEAETLQELFTKIYQYSNFLSYVSYLLERNLDFVHFTPFADFRGRLYYRSEASIQSLWCFRFIYYFKKIPTNEKVHNASYSFEQNFLKINVPDCTNTAAFEFILAIGMLFKTEKINLLTGEFNLEDIFELGLQYYKKYKNLDLIQESKNFELKDLAELYYYINAFSIEKNNSTRGYYIWKDTTASVIQHGGKLLGYKTQMLKYLNLSNNLVAYDTYQVVINEIKLRLKTTNLSEEIIDKLDRKILKELIMTCEYQVSWQTARRHFTYLVNTLTKENIKNNSLLNPELFKQLFYLLKGGLVTELFFQKTKRDWYKETSQLPLELDDLTFTNIYYKPNYAILYFDKKNTNRRERFTMKALIPSWEAGEKKQIDTRKMHQATYVNCLHAYDALYLRAICRLAKSHRIELAAVHDGFGVAYYHSRWLVKAANEVFWLKKTTEINFSSTIII